MGLDASTEKKRLTSDKTWGAAFVLPDEIFSTRTFLATGRANKAKASLAADARFSSSSEEYDIAKDILVTYYATRIRKVIVTFGHGCYGTKCTAAACHSLEPLNVFSLESWSNEMLVDLGQMKKVCIYFTSSSLYSLPLIR
jgi:hypothetical protein